MNSRIGGGDSRVLTSDELSVEAELLSYAARVAPTPSAGFADRVLAAAEVNRFQATDRSLRVRAADLIHGADTQLRVALAHVLGGPAIPLKVRLQAGAMLVVVALLVTAGAAVAATGATSVFHWVTGPQASHAGGASSVSPASGASSVSPALQPIRSSEASQTSDHAGGSDNPGTGGKSSQDPGECGQPINNPGNGNKPNINPGNCGQPSTKPGNKPSTNPGNKPSTKPSH